MVPWNGSRTKVQLKLSIQRLRTLQEKKLALAKKSRRDIADLLLKNRVETARLRVEGLIQDDIYVELLELLELYVELLSARFNLLDASTGTEPEGSISDAVCAIVYAAPRTELKELQQLREMLMHKYGRPFALSLQSTEPAPPTVPARIRSKLAIYTPERELVDAYLYEIAKGYNVDWRPEPPADAVDGTSAAAPGEGDDGAGDDGPGGGLGETTKPQAEPVAVAARSDSPTKAAGALQDVTASGGVDAGSGGKNGGEGEKAAAPVSAPAAKKLSPEEELAARFERLKRLQ